MQRGGADNLFVAVMRPAEIGRYVNGLYLFCLFSVVKVLQCLVPIWCSSQLQASWLVAPCTEEKECPENSAHTRYARHAKQLTNFELKD